MQGYTLCPVKDPASKPMWAAVKTEDRDLLMDVDNGASVTVISEATLGQIWGTQPAPPLQPTDMRLHKYTGDEIPTVGGLTVRYTVPCRRKNNNYRTGCYHTRQIQPAGKRLPSKLKRDCKNIFSVQVLTMQDVLGCLEAVFTRVGQDPMLSKTDPPLSETVVDTPC